MAKKNPSKERLEVGGHQRAGDDAAPAASLTMYRSVRDSDPALASLSSSLSDDTSTNRSVSMLDDERGSAVEVCGKGSPSVSPDGKGLSGPLYRTSVLLESLETSMAPSGTTAWQEVGRMRHRDTDLGDSSWYPSDSSRAEHTPCRKNRADECPRSPRARPSRTWRPGMAGGSSRAYSRSRNAPFPGAAVYTTHPNADFIREFREDKRARLVKEVLSSWAIPPVDLDRGKVSEGKLTPELSVVSLDGSRVATKTSIDRKLYSLGSEARAVSSGLPVARGWQSNLRLHPRSKPPPTPPSTPPRTSLRRIKKSTVEDIANAAATETVGCVPEDAPAPAPPPVLNLEAATKRSSAMDPVVDALATWLSVVPEQARSQLHRALLSLMDEHRTEDTLSTWPEEGKDQSPASLASLVRHQQDEHPRPVHIAAKSRHTLHLDYCTVNVSPWSSKSIIGLSTLEEGIALEDPWGAMRAAAGLRHGDAADGDVLGVDEAPPSVIVSKASTAAPSGISEESGPAGPTGSHVLLPPAPPVDTERYPGEPVLPVCLPQGANMSSGLSVVTHTGIPSWIASAATAPPTIGPTVTSATLDTSQTTATSPSPSAGLQDQSAVVALGPRELVPTLSSEDHTGILIVEQGDSAGTVGVAPSLEDPSSGLYDVNSLPDQPIITSVDSDRSSEAQGHGLGPQRAAIGFPDKPFLAAPPSGTVGQQGRPNAPLASAELGPSVSFSPSVTAATTGTVDAPALRTHSSQDFDASEVQVITICTMLNHLNTLLENFQDRPETPRRGRIQSELERRLLTLFDQTQPRVHCELLPTAKKFASNVSYWMESYLIQAEQSLARL